MSKSASGVDNTQRRKWDKDEYQQRALQRQREEEEAEEDAKRQKVAANLGIVVRQPLNQGAIIQRDYAKDLKARIGQKQLVNPDTGEGMGFYCKESGKILRDSLSYLDHINGKKQQRALGLSMRVERSSLQQVQEKLEQKKLEKEMAKAAAPSFDERVALREEEEEMLRQQRKERKQEKKKQKDEPQDDIDPEMAAMMGFGGFGSSKKH